MQYVHVFRGTFSQNLGSKERFHMLFGEFEGESCFSKKVLSPQDIEELKTKIERERNPPTKISDFECIFLREKKEFSEN